MRTALPTMLALLACAACVGEPPPLPPAGLGMLGDSDTTTADDGASASVTSSPDDETKGSLPDDPDDSGAIPATDSGGPECDGGGGLGAACDPLADDCPPCFKCAPWADDGGGAWNAANCRPVAADPAGPGDACTVEGSAVSGIDDCDVGSMCWISWISGTGTSGTCVEFCTDGPQGPYCDGPGSACHVTNGGVLPLCLPICDLLVQDCPDGQACYSGAAAWVPVCQADVSGAAGGLLDPCEFVNVCDAGSACVPAEAVAGCGGSGCCTPYCDRLDPQCPAAAPNCEPWWDVLGAVTPLGQDDVGVCVP